jgi:hypothetical protein
MVEPQPPPTTGEQEVYPEAIRIFLQTMRQQMEKGIEEYGTPLKTHNGRDALVDAMYEVIDLWMYLVQKYLEQQSFPSSQQ